jgi:cold shock CspA family protein
VDFSGGNMKKRISGTFAVLLSALLLITACSSGTKVPDVSGSDVETAKTVLATLGFVPTVSEEVSESVEAGIVIESDPAAGETLSPGSKVELTVSKGPKRITVTNGTASWSGVGVDENWAFDFPYIEDGTLHLTFSNVKFDAKVKWWDPNKNGNGFGQASITDTFNKKVPLDIKWQRQSSAKGQAQLIEIKVPINDLDVQKPTTMYLRLFAEINGVYQEIGVDLTFSW